jgi:hypothetical protein
MEDRYETQERHIEDLKAQLAAHGIPFSLPARTLTPLLAQSFGDFD